MLSNYLKIALRTLWKNRLYTAINVIGLAIAITFGLLVYQYAHHEFTFDRFHRNADTIYRIDHADMTTDQQWYLKRSGFLSLINKTDSHRSPMTPFELGPALKTSLPDVADVVRVIDHSRETYDVRVGNQQYEQRCIFADPNFLRVFSFPLRYGNSATALSHPNQVVISAKLAEQFFGKSNPVGQTLHIRLADLQPFVVQGVLENVPLNSSFQPAILLPLEHHESYRDFQKSGTSKDERFGTVTWVQVRAGTNERDFVRNLDHFTRQFFKAYIAALPKNDSLPTTEPVFRLSPKPLTQVHFDTGLVTDNTTNPLYCYILLSLAMLVLVIACLNYVSLTLANTAARTQEVGVRKAVGANRRQLFFQLWLETQLVTLVAFGLAVLFVEAALPSFNHFVQRELALTWSDPDVVGACVAIVVLIGGLAGGYPALVLAGFRPVQLLQGNRTYQFNPFLSRTLLVIQYSLCLFLIMAALVMNRQMQFIAQKDLGFDKERILYIPNQENDPKRLQLLHQRMQAYARSSPDVLAVSSASGSFGSGRNSMRREVQGKMSVIGLSYVDENYVPLLKLRLIRGRNFSASITSDTAQSSMAMVINETFAKLLGKDLQLGKPIDEVSRIHVIGVLKDYHFDTFETKIGPAMLLMDVSRTGGFLVKLRPGTTPTTLAKLKKDWTRLSDGKPFDYSFFDQDIAKQYESYTRWLTIIKASSAFALLIACLGLFGLAGLNASNRTKEVGIRKVLGASVFQLFTLLNRDIVWLVSTAFALAVPGSWWLMSRWLEDFAYRIDISWDIFVLSGAAGLLTAIVAVSFHTGRAALMNPVKSLRSE